VSGDFGVEKKTNQDLYISGNTAENTLVANANLLTIGLANVDAFVGFGSIGLQLDDVDLAIALWSEVGGAARSWTSVMGNVGSASFIGVTSLTIAASNVGIVVNKENSSDHTVVDYVKGTGEMDATTLKVSVSSNIADDVTFAIDDVNGDYVRVTGHADIGLFGIVTVSGDFGVEKKTNQNVVLSTGTATANLLTIGLSNVSAFLGFGQGTANALGIQLTGIDLAIALWTENIETNPRSWTSVKASVASASLVGLPVLDLSVTTFGIEVNKPADDGTVVNYVGAAATHLDVVVGPGKTVRFDLDGSQGDLVRAFGRVTITISNFVTISGDFGFEKRTENGVSKILVGAANISTFLGTSDGSMGVSITNAFFGMVLIQNQEQGGENKYAVTAGGSAAIVGFEGILELSGSLTVKVNKTGAAVNEHIRVGAGYVDVVFDNGDDVMGFYGSVSLKIVNFVSISGDFGFEKSVSGGTTKILVGATNINVFLGVGAGTPNAIGLQVSNANLGVVLYQTESGDSKYALSAEGTAALVGLPGLIIEGSLAVKINKTGRAVNEIVRTGGGEVPVVFTTSEEIQIFSGSITLKVLGVFELHGEVSATIRANGTVLVDIPVASLAITVDGKEIFAIVAAIRFAITKSDGFRLLDMRLTGIRFMGMGGTPTPDYAGQATAMFEAGLEEATLPPGSRPGASLAFPFADGEIDVSVLNKRKYIDVTYTDYSGQGLNYASIQDTDPEFTFSGAGVGDAVISSVEQLDGGNTFRYHLADSNTGNDVGLFKSGSVSVAYTLGTWADKSGQTNTAKSETFTVVDGGATSPGEGTKLGPITLKGPSFSIEDFQFTMVERAGGTMNPRLLIMVGLGMEKASIDFGGGTKAELTDLLGAFELAVDLDMNDLFKFPDISATGKFKIAVGGLLVEIPDVLEVTGEGILINYDPNGAADQEIVRVNSLSIEIIPISLKGALEPFTRSDGTTIPGLSIRNNGFALGSASLQYTGAIEIASILKIQGIKAGVSDVNVTYGQDFVFNGEVFIAADGAWLFPGGAFEVSITDGSDADTEAVRASLTFTGNKPDGFKFKADQISFKFAGVLEINGSGVYIDTTASGDPNKEVASFVSIGATLNAGPLQVTGEMRNFAFMGDGSFKTNPGFGVFIEIGSVSGGSVGWPDWLPIRITAIGLEWADINNHPDEFVLTLSASVTGLYGLPFNFSGSVDGIKIDLGALKRGEFPIIDIAAIAVSVDGDMFGGRISGSLLGGILKVDDQYNVIPSTDTFTPVHKRIFFMGIAGGFEMDGWKFGIRFALSELGPLGITLNVRSVRLWVAKS